MIDTFINIIIAATAVVKEDFRWNYTPFIILGSSITKMQAGR